MNSVLCVNFVRAALQMTLYNYSYDNYNNLPVIIIIYMIILPDISVLKFYI